MRWLVAAAFFGFAQLGSDAAAATFGWCKFDVLLQSFAGSAKDQAACLLRKVSILGNVDKNPALLPSNLAGIVGVPVSLSKSKFRQFIAGFGLAESDLGGSLDAPLSRGQDNNPRAPMARYFVIHDTSSPNFKGKPFPSDIDTSKEVNGFGAYRSASNAKAHIFLNRRGELYVGHGFSVPWRATKLESRVIGRLSKGLFLHVENIQPRRAHPAQPDGNAPMPGFTAAQYDRLALLYVAASIRAGKGLIPAFHAPIDEGLGGGHDDPQNFSLDDLDDALGRVLEKLQ